MNPARISIHYRIDWKNGGSTIGDWEYIAWELDEIFSELYQEVVIESLKDPLTGDLTESPENIRTIRINIRKLNDSG